MPRGQGTTAVSSRASATCQVLHVHLAPRSCVPSTFAHLIFLLFGLNFIIIIIPLRARGSTTLALLLLLWPPVLPMQALQQLRDPCARPCLECSVHAPVVFITHGHTAQPWGTQPRERRVQPQRACIEIAQLFVQRVATTKYSKAIQVRQGGLAHTEIAAALLQASAEPLGCLRRAAPFIRRHHHQHSCAWGKAPTPSLLLLLVLCPCAIVAAAIFVTAVMGCAYAARRCCWGGQQDLMVACCHVPAAHIWQACRRTSHGQLLSKPASCAQLGAVQNSDMLDALTVGSSGLTQRGTTTTAGLLTDCISTRAAATLFERRSCSLLALTTVMPVHSLPASSLAAATGRYCCRSMLICVCSSVTWLLWGHK
mmetsp:Transcript_13791/g.37267  ORF Transcript_13791/g.37267 Transcript_13791/m.37267 type:complete len:368 (-) Transcript_13791:125-1228(-)